MMSSADELRFDGRVAIVTGAGNGIGRAHALSLAARGASVLVNDGGYEVDGSGESSPEPARAVAAEIVAAGGTALSNTASVADREGAASIVEDTLKAFGRLDIVINNAGVLVPPTAFAETPAEVFQRELDVNYLGAVNVLQVAWPHLIEAGYGRVVNTSSGSMFGWPDNPAYACAKAAVFTLTRSLAADGAEHGIKVNGVGPGAYTRMTGARTAEAEGALAGNSSAASDGGWNPELDAQSAFMAKAAPPSKVSPAVVFMAHESCPFNGEVLSSAAGVVARWILAETQGYVNPEITAEDVRDNIAQIFDESSYEAYPKLPDLLAGLKAKLKQV